MFFSRKVYHPRTEVPQNAGKFVWQIIYRTKEKCLETITGYVTKKLAEYFGQKKCRKIAAKFSNFWPFSTKMSMPNLISHDLIGAQLSAASRRGTWKIFEENRMTTAKIMDKKPSKRAKIGQIWQFSAKIGMPNLRSHYLNIHTIIWHQ